MLDHEAKRREQWNTFRALLQAGCSIPYELRHIERQYRDRVRRMVGNIPAPPQRGPVAATGRSSNDNQNPR